MKENELADHLDTLANIAHLVSMAVPRGTPSQVAIYAGNAFQMGSVIARAGKDPLQELTRIVNEDQVIKAIRDEADQAMEKKFGPEGGTDESSSEGNEGQS